MGKAIRLLLFGILILGMVFGSVMPAYATNAMTTVVRASTDASGTEAAGGASTPGNMTPDGRYVVFFSSATNLVAGDTNGTSDIFVKDMQTGAISRVSTDSTGAQSNGSSGSPSISDDARYVVFASLANNLVAGDTNGVYDVFKKDRQTGVITRVSTDSSGAQVSAASFNPNISADARYVTFYSSATNLVAGDTNASQDVFVKDTQTGTTTRVSTDSSGAQANNGSYYTAITPDGRYIVFVSYATNLVTGDTNGVEDIFLKDTQTNATTRASTNSSGVQFTPSSGAYPPDVSDDGRYVTFDTNGEIYVKDMLTQTLTRASSDSSGGGTAVFADYSPVISGNGRYVLFYSYADDMVPGDTNTIADIFVKDMGTGLTARITTDSLGVEANNWPDGYYSISSDGKYVTFKSSATNLVSGDTNGHYDVFYRINPLYTVLVDQDFSGTTLDAGTSSGSVLGSATKNGQPIDAEDYVLSITDDGGLTGVTINADGTLTIPEDAESGTYTVTYQVCESAAPTYCNTATAVLGVSVSTSELAETGTRQFVPAVAGLALIVLAAKIVRTRRHFRNHYRARW